MTEGTILGIPQELVEKTEEEADTVEDLEGYVKDQLDLIDREQQELYGFIQVAGKGLGIKDIFSYSLGAALSYRMIPEEERNVDLTTSQLATVRNSLRESITTTGKERGTINVSWFVEKMQNDSPSYSGWLEEMVTGLGDPQSTNDFILGSFIVVMPFYQRAEARLLAEKFE